MNQSAALKLSICIPTFNRATFIGDTLKSIIEQATDECEIVVSDNASTDSTEQVVFRFSESFDRLRYIRQPENVGFDINCDSAVNAANGDYCWLFSDDDVMKPGALRLVLEAVHHDHTLILINGEHLDVSMSKVCVPSFFGISSNRVYTSAQFDQLFSDVGTCVMCLCCVVLKKSLWLARERQRYYGSWFIHTAVVFQDHIPGTTFVIAKPLISLRLGNHHRMVPQVFHIWFIEWPSLIWSFPIHEETKASFCSVEPWKRLKYLLALRGTGRYSRTEYERWVRPRLSGAQEVLIPFIVAILPPWLAATTYALCSVMCGWPKFPHEPSDTMWPESFRRYMREKRRRLVTPTFGRTRL
jgi:abequosyltransferase